MTASWKWPGSRWWRVDLHAHSPASYDFRPVADRQAKDWAAWLSAAQSAGLDAVAVTDHNSAEGISALQQAARAVPGAPALFPGVEITADDGTHLLFLLDPSCGQAHVEEILTLAKIPVDGRGKPEARSPLSVEQLLDLECGRGILVLGAHVNGPAGLLEHDGQQRIAVLSHRHLAGVEVDPNHDLDETWLDGSRPEISRRLSRIWASDSHSHIDAGRRFTWMKMTEPNAEGLRLALLDGPSSLRSAHPAEPGDPNRHAAQAIESITVRNAKYMGRTEPLHIDFNPWLNAVIGGRGTGKSTLIDLCRAAFRRESELTEGGETSLRAAFDKRIRIPPSRSEEGLLEETTVVEVTYRKDGERFLLSWDEKGQNPAISRLDGDQRIPEQGDIRQLFPVRIYSQKQLFDLAKQPNALLTVIDDSAEVRGAELLRLLKEAETRYLSLCAEARALQAQAADLPGLTAQLDDGRRKLRLLQQGGHAQTLNHYRSRRRQDGTWESIRTTAGEAVEAVEMLARDRLVVPDLDVGPDADDDVATAALKRAHQGLRATVESLQRTMLEAVVEARTEIAGAVEGPDAQAWRAAVAASEEAYQAVTQQLEAAGIAAPDEYRDLLQRATTLNQEISILGTKGAESAERERDAAAALARYRELRTQLTTRRQEFAAATSNEMVRIEIQGHSQRGEEHLEAFLRDALGIARFEGDHSALVQRILPDKAAPWTFDSLDETIQQLRDLRTDPKKPFDWKDSRFGTALGKLQPERIDRLALYLPDDAVKVSFCDPRNSRGSWQKLAQGSPGQQTAALLAFVLGYGHEPILLDQPEDDLDNTLIYELLVQNLRARKPTRQVIVVTHNPNIVVHGDAELVISLQSTCGQTKIAFAGGLQEQEARDEICRVMEGGREAFETRYRRIMLSGEHLNGQT